MGVIPWSPLASGRLTRDWDEVTTRSETDEYSRRLYADEDQSIVESVADIASKRGIPRAQVVLAWMLRKPVISATIVGVMRLARFHDALDAVDVELSSEEIEELERPYEPHGITGHCDTTYLWHLAVTAPAYERDQAPAMSE